jgi:predicted dithiol-disulfide oxidoreductase (DUF899 family)
MSPRVVSGAEWLAARKELQAAEEEAVSALEQIASRRRDMPAVRIEKDYVFEGRAGKASLLDLFERLLPRRRHRAAYLVRLRPDHLLAAPERHPP